MSAGSILVAGIGNIFQGDDAFGVSVIRELARRPLAREVRLMDVGIRSIDLGFALLDDHELTILIDATARGCDPGTIYTIEIADTDIPDYGNEAEVVNSHSLDAVRVLALAKGMGARFGRVLLVGCEPLVTDHDNSGHIGLSAPVEAAVPLAATAVCELIQEFKNTLEEEEVCFNEST